MIEQIKTFDYQGRDLAVKVNELIEASNQQEERQNRLERAIKILAVGEGKAMEHTINTILFPSANN